MCREFRTGAYSLATGATLWEVDGFRSVTAAGDGLAMMSTRTGDESSSGWALVDLATGAPVRADQVWPEPTAFLTECCGGYEYQRVDQHDGVLAVQTGRRDPRVPPGGGLAHDGRRRPRPPLTRALGSSGHSRDEGDRVEVMTSVSVR